jgi:iron complex transport system ATP-binding protein
VLVTHHVEEIMPAFSHVLVLKNGCVTAAGAKEKTLTSRVLGEAFGACVRLHFASGRATLAIVPSKRGDVTARFAL